MLQQLQALTTTAVRMGTVGGTTRTAWTDGAITSEAVVVDPGAAGAGAGVVADEALDVGAIVEGDRTTTALTIQTTQQNTVR
jgi:hypothetical protein